MWLGSADEGSPARELAGVRSSPVFRSNRIAAGPARLPASLLVRGRQGCGLAVMAAVGIQLGSVDEGSLPGGPGSLVACVPVERMRTPL